MIRLKRIYGRLSHQISESVGKCVSQHYAQCCIQLPSQHQGPSDFLRWHTFRSINWDRCAFRSNSKAKKQATSKKLLPVLAECLLKTRGEAEHAAHHDCTTSTIETIERFCQAVKAVSQSSTRSSSSTREEEAQKCCRTSVWEVLARIDLQA